MAHRVFKELLDQLAQLALLGSEERMEIPVTPEHLVLWDLQDLLDNLDHMVLLDQRETRELLAQLVRLGQVATRVHRASEDPRVQSEHLGLPDHKDRRVQKDFKGPAVILVSLDQLGLWDPVDLLAQSDLREQLEVQDLRARKDQSEHRDQVVPKVPLARSVQLAMEVLMDQ